MSQKKDPLSVQPEAKEQEKALKKEPTEKPNKWKDVRKAATDGAETHTIEDAIITSEDQGQSVKDAKHLALEEQIEQLEKELKEAKDALLYQQAAEADNKKRYIKELQKTKLYSGSNVIEEFVKLLDSIEAANLQHGEVTLEQLKEGTQNISDLMHSIFKKLGVKEINSAVGETFDPNVHSAVATEISEDPDQPSDVIIKELRKGYLLHERVIRPAMVIISQSKE